MVLQRTITTILLAFVTVSLAVAVADVTGLRPADPVTRPAEVSTGEQLIVYYFHSSTRCPTCRTIERFTNEVIADDAKAGTVDWRVVNYEEPAHRHFVPQFDLVCPSVVLVHTRDGEVTRWKNLERVWEWTDDRSAFHDYIRTELTAFREVQP
jgi:hypothetical protein